MSAELKIYEVTNTTTGKKHYAVSDSPDNACKQAGLAPADCFVSEQKPKRQHAAINATRLVYKIPCQVCPFQYGECIKPPNVPCPVPPNTPDQFQWLKAAAKAHLCACTGQTLSEHDYHLQQKWVTLAQALEELGDHHKP